MVHGLAVAEAVGGAAVVRWQDSRKNQKTWEEKGKETRENGMGEGRREEKPSSLRTTAVSGGKLHKGGEKLLLLRGKGELLSLRKREVETFKATRLLVWNN